MKRAFFPLAIVLFVILTAGCERIGVTDIGKILEDPRAYAGRTVTVSGQASEVFSLFVVKYFVVQDKTGQIAVVTDRPLPKTGATVKVRGTVREAFSIGDRQLLVLVEETEK